MVDDTKIGAFKEALRGRLVVRSDDDYDTVRAVHNAMIDKRPRLMSRCVNAADAMTAVRFARENDTLVAARGGGHNGACLGAR